VWDSIWIDVAVATLEPGADAYGLIADAAIGVEGEQIAWVGERRELTQAPERLARRIHSGGGRCLLPGLIDCHTHLIFGGDRASEFEQRAAGASYAEIAAAGGGIASTVARTRALSVDELVAAALPRARALLSEGVTTLEIKSGYGLDPANELKLLRAARALGALVDVEVVPTLLALHALPRESAADRAGYIDRVCNELIPQVAREGLARAVDVFCESIAFTPAECARALEAARTHGLAVKMHAEQLSDQGGAIVAAAHGALSADHLEYLSLRGVEALARSGTVAVLLPGAYLLLRERQPPPVAALRAHQVPMALATDCNPGTSPSTSLQLMLPLACTLFGLTPAEAVAGVTRHAAAALGLADSHGTLRAGKRADFALFDIAHPRELAYWLGGNRCHSVVRGGRLRTPAA
jgi:imidazolonepropionase